MTLTETVYVVAGILLPAYYLPQMLTCAVDETRLAAYSMSKAASQLALRMAMLPFVFGIGNLTMTCVVALDFAGRASEFAIAVWSLSRQGVTPREILGRCLPFWRLRDAGKGQPGLRVAHRETAQQGIADAGQAGSQEANREPTGTEPQAFEPSKGDGPLRTWLSRRPG